MQLPMHMLLNANLQCHLNPAAKYLKPQFNYQNQLNVGSILSDLCSNPGLSQNSVCFTLHGIAAGISKQVHKVGEIHQFTVSVS